MSQKTERSHKLAPAEPERKIIPGVLKREFHLDNEQDKIAEQENFVFDFPAGCFWCLRHWGFGFIDETTIE